MRLWSGNTPMPYAYLQKNKVRVLELGHVCSWPWLLQCHSYYKQMRVGNTCSINFNNLHTSAKTTVLWKANERGHIITHLTKTVHKRWLQTHCSPYSTSIPQYLRLCTPETPVSYWWTINYYANTHRGTKENAAKLMPSSCFQKQSLHCHSFQRLLASCCQNRTVHPLTAPFGSGRLFFTDSFTSGEWLRCLYLSRSFGDADRLYKHWTKRRKVNTNFTYKCLLSTFKDIHVLNNANLYFWW